VCKTKSRNALERLPLRPASTPEIKVFNDTWRALAKRASSSQKAVSSDTLVRCPATMTDRFVLVIMRPVGELFPLDQPKHHIALR
jgi:hypothetical protein